MVHACHPSYAGSINWRFMVQADLEIHRRACSKNNKSTKGEGMAQVIEYLPESARA
jgi:hypothetical protein